MLKQPKSPHYKPSPIMMIIVLLALISLACSLGAGSAKTVRIKNTLSTLTPTAAAVSQAAAATEAPNQLSGSLLITVTPTRVRHLPTLTPTAMANQMAGVTNQPVISAPPAAAQPSSNPPIAPTSTATPTPSSSANPTATPPSSAPTPISPAPLPTLPPAPDPTEIPKSEVPGWSFAGIRSSIDQGNATVLGELINNTGAPQTEVQVSAILYDQYDRVIIDGIDTLDYVPVDIVPVGARIPFELVVESDQSIYRIDLVSLSAPADSAPRQDFQFASVSQRIDQAGLYCIGGIVKNLGSPLAEQLIVLATTYDSHGQVVSFGEHAEGSPGRVSADQTSPFEICIDPVGQQITSHELRAVGL